VEDANSARAEASVEIVRELQEPKIRVSPCRGSFAPSVLQVDASRSFDPNFGTASSERAQASISIQFVNFTTECPTPTIATDTAFNANNESKQMQINATALQGCTLKFGVIGKGVATREATRSCSMMILAALTPEIRISTGDIGDKINSGDAFSLNAFVTSERLAMRVWWTVESPIFQVSPIVVSLKEDSVQNRCELDCQFEEICIVYFYTFMLNTLEQKQYLRQGANSTRVFYISSEQWRHKICHSSPFWCWSRFICAETPVHVDVACCLCEFIRFGFSCILCFLLDINLFVCCRNHKHFGIYCREHCTTSRTAYGDTTEWKH